MTDTYRILGTAMNNACTATFNPSFLWITLKGLSNLSTLIALNTDRSDAVTILSNDIITMKKSTMSHTFRRYEPLPLTMNPFATILMVTYCWCLPILSMHSSKNINVIVIFKISRFLLKFDFGSFNGFSIANVIDEIIMQHRMTISNHA